MSFLTTLAQRPVTRRFIDDGSTDTAASASTINRVNHSSLAAPCWAGGDAEEGAGHA